MFRGCFSEKIPLQNPIIAVGVFILLTKLAESLQRECDELQDSERSDVEFEKVAESEYFVDKTLLINAWVEHFRQRRGIDAVASAPTGFGKTVNLKMLKTFFTVNVNDSEMFGEPYKTKEVFREFEIYKYQYIFYEHCGMHRVIYVDLKCNDNVSSTDDVYAQLGNALRRTYREHLYLLQYIDENITWDSFEPKKKLSSFTDLKKLSKIPNSVIIQGLRDLSHILFQHFDRKSIVLIDNIDSAISKSIFKESIDTEAVSKMISDMISNLAYNDFGYVSHCFITGTHCIDLCLPNNLMPIHKAATFSFVDGTSGNYYGATEEEVKHLFAKHGISKELAEDARAWYGGYCSRESGIAFYNMRSIITFLKHRQIAAYWTFTGAVTKCAHLFSKPIIAPKIGELLLNKPIAVSISRINGIHCVAELKALILNPSSNITSSDADLFLTYLLYLGCLTYAEKCVGTSDVCLLKVPNKEVLTQIQKMVVKL